MSKADPNRANGSTKPAIKEEEQKQQTMKQEEEQKHQTMKQEDEQKKEKCIEIIVPDDVFMNSQVAAKQPQNSNSYMSSYDYTHKINTQTDTSLSGDLCLENSVGNPQSIGSLDSKITYN